MLKIKCPFCGVRDESEFSCGGEAHIVRPTTDLKLTDNLARDTVSHEIIEIYPMGVFPKTVKGKKAYQANWRRKSKSEAVSKPAKRTKK